MPVVPRITERTALEKAGPLALASPDAPAGAFGATQGRAIARLGEQVIGISDDIFKASIALQDEDDQREFKKLDIELSSFIRELGIGDGSEDSQGFLGTEGENTIVAFPKAQIAIQNKRAELLAGASNNRVKNMFAISSEQRVEKSLSSFLTHVTRERKKANKATSLSRIQEATDDATSAPFDRDVLERSLVVVEAEAASLFKDFSQDVIDSEVEKAVTDLLDKVIRAASQQDNRQARKIFDDFLLKIDGVSRGAISTRLAARDKELLRLRIEAENRAEKELKDRQDATFVRVILGIAKETVSEDLVFLLLEKGGLRPLQHAKALKLLREDDIISDPDTLLALEVDIRLGNISSEDVEDADNISNKDKIAFITLVDEVARRGGILARDDIKRHLKDISQRVGGERGPFAILNPGATSRVRNAIVEFETRVLAGEDPQAVRDSVIDAFVDSDVRSILQGLARPPFLKLGRGAGNKEQKMEDVKEATKELVRNRKNMSEAEYERALDRMDKWKTAVEKLVK